MNCNYKGCKECIFYNTNETKCMRRSLSPMAKDIVSSPILLDYIRDLKNRVIFCELNALELPFAFEYWHGQADCIKSILNDLGFGYLFDAIR